MGTQPAGLLRNTSRIILGLFLLASAFAAAQNVTFSKVEHSSENKSKVLYRISPANPQSEYLGEAEIVKVGARPEEIFAEFYKKAKQIGANSYAVQDSIAAAYPDFKVKLYYTPENNIPAEQNTFYVLSSDDRTKKIAVNGKVVELDQDSYLRVRPSAGADVTVSTRRLLGSTVRFTYSDSQPARYFLLTSARVSENPDGSPGIRLKSGDITGLERSYAEFLMIGRRAKDF